MDAKPLRAADITHMLERHYIASGKPAGGILAVEIDAPNGCRRADAIWAPITASGGTGLVGHEIKVSRTDVMAELTDPTKSDAWMKYCRRWWLTVSDPTLIEGLDIPDTWGVMAPPSGRRTRSMTIIVPAPDLHPIEPAPAWRKVLAWHHYRSNQRVEQAQQNERFQEGEKIRLTNELQEIRRGQIARRDPRAARIDEVLSALAEVEATQEWGSGVPHVYDDSVPAMRIARALMDVEKIEEVRNRLSEEIKRQAAHAKGVLEPLTKIGEALEKIESESCPHRVSHEHL